MNFLNSRVKNPTTCKKNVSKIKYTPKIWKFDVFKIKSKSKLLYDELTRFLGVPSKKKKGVFFISLQPLDFERAHCAVPARNKISNKIV